MDQVNQNTAVIDKIRRVISAYKADFETADKQERYKWEAIGWYKQHWNMNAEDFAEMVTSAFGKTFNLLASGMYYPYKMLCEYAQADPEAVRALFRILHDETIPLADRYQAFRKGFEMRVAQLREQNPNREKQLQHYQDLRAVMVYLTFEYPEKYFLFKSRMFTTFRDRVGYTEKKQKQKSTVWKIESYIRLCELILAEVEKDPELIRMSESRLDAACYKDPEHHLLTMDLVFYGSAYMSEKDFQAPTASNLADEYWPSLEEYDPRMTKAMWLAALKDSNVTTQDTLAMLRMMLDLGGESTCARLAQVYGNTHSHYNILGSTFGKRVKEKFLCPDCPDQDDDSVPRNRLYVIPFIGRNVMEDGNKRFSWKLRTELREALESMNLPETVTATEDSATNVGLNTILYGPPGTGKTYHTVIYAVAIIENKELAVVEKEDYADVLDRYKQYKAQGRIEFTTFHQSYGYEEFIEGIRPSPVDEGETANAGNIQYSVQPGIFKKFCEKADQPVSVRMNANDLGVRENATIWKVSLEGTGDNPTRTECMKNNHIRIGWDEYGKDITDETDFSKHGGRVVLNAFMNKMQIGDIVLSCYSASAIDAVGVVTGDYEWHDEYPQLKRLRKVKWLVKGIQENILAINGGTPLTLASTYRLAYVSIADVFQIVEKYQPTQLLPADHKENYVFIIDEINRGNISKIFGELITLIEASKRIGQTEGMKAILPYSQKPFGVPKNVYIIGTMNTADRSIATIDTALRRRFFFKEMMPQPDVLAGVSVEDLSISDLLSRINKRIAVLYDREHTIGHAYFMPLMRDPTIETLAEIFTNNIIPLLQEYFYEDYEKIRLVLGDNRKKSEEHQFIIAKDNDYTALFGDVDVGLDDGRSYEINYSAFGEIEAYRSI